MSETNDDEPEGLTREGADSGAEPGEVDLEALAAEDGDPDDAVDMSDLDALGVEGVVARLRSDGGDEVEPLGKGRPRRSPVVSVLVVAFGAYLLVTMFGDLRYWLRSSEPVELGHAATLLQDGRTLDAYADQYVALEGTPDVQHAARLTTKERFVGYLRVTEGGGGLFAAVPRPKDQPATNNFEGRYVGRLRRLRDDRAYQWLAEFYANEQVTRAVDLDPATLPGALSSGSLPVAGGGSISARPHEQVRLVFEGPDARVQLGKTSFPDAAAAEQAVAGLGHPYVRLSPTATFHRFVVRVPPGQRASAQQALNAGLEGVEDVTDPKVGAMVLDLPANYGAPLGEIRAEGDQITFPYGDNATSPGYDVVDGRLVERPARERLSLPVAALTSARLERVIEVDPDGFVVAVGEQPGDAWTMGALWLLALVITGANLASLVLWWRRRSG
ncbi:MAG: hypothetical protein KDK70_35515 [Myxococcales bacterium]|nr:hypothetical protein [Myxococcales bacterium]